MAFYTRTTIRRALMAFSLAGAAFSVSLPVGVFAEPPAQLKTQAPGFYRMALGEYEVTALYDGYTELPVSLMKGASEADIQSLLAHMFISTTHGMQTSVNGYLINTGSNLILVDAGTAKCFTPTLGRIPDNIRAAGYDPAQIDTVLLTHLHGDHACGVATADGKMAFPNAQVWTAKAEADYWLSEEVAAKAPKEAQPFFKMSRDAVAPYVAAGKLKTFVQGDTLVPGVTAEATPGHTPGHTSYLFKPKSGEQHLLVWGDIVHNYAVQFPRPEVAFDFDVDSKQAVVTREKLLADVAKGKVWIAGAHLPFPGLGHVRAESKGYSWVPVEYGPVRSDH